MELQSSIARKKIKDDTVKIVDSKLQSVVPEVLEEVTRLHQP